MRNFMVFDIGGSSTKWSVITEEGGFKESNKFESPDNADEFFCKLIEVTEEMKNKYDVNGIAISAPGAVDSNAGVIGGLSAIPYIHGPNFKEILNKSTGLAAQLEKMSLKHEFSKIMKVLPYQDVFYGIILENSTDFFIQQLDNRHCKLRQVQDGLYNFKFDLYSKNCQSIH